MAVSKRLRFEVLRRDNHACRYCGASAPDVKLTVDHVTPEALGGGHDPDNLVTACEGCNSGKSSIAPDSPIVEDVRQDALRWTRAIAAAAELIGRQREEANSYVREFYNYSVEVDGASHRGSSPIAWPGDWETSVRTFHKYGLPVEEIKHAYWRADTSSKVYSRGGWKYFCGICWSKLADIRKVAEALLAEQDGRE